MVNLELLVFLPVILFLGIITSYQDIKEGKIRNKWIILGIAYALVIYLILITFYLFFGEVNTYYIFELLTNFLFAILAGFGLWYISIWTAGDGKLFIAYSMLIPFSVYSLGYTKWFPSLTILVNTFLPAFIGVFALMLIKTKIKHLKKVFIEFLKETFRIRSLLRSGITIFAILWFVDILLSLVGLGGGLILRMGLTILISLGISSKLPNKSPYVLAGACILRLILDKSVYSWSFLINFLIIVFVWKIVSGFLRGSVSKLGFEVFSKDIKVKELKPGMVLSEVIIKKKKITKEEMKKLGEQFRVEIINYKGSYYIKKPKSHVDPNNFIGEEAEGLTKEQIKMIREIGIKKIGVSTTIPFAPFIFLGVLITLIVKGNLIAFLATIF